MGNDATIAILKRIKRIAEEERGSGADDAAWVRVADFAEFALERMTTTKRVASMTSEQKALLLLGLDYITEDVSYDAFKAKAEALHADMGSVLIWLMTDFRNDFDALQAFIKEVVEDHSVNVVFEGHPLSLALEYISGKISRDALIEQCSVLMLDEYQLDRWTITEYENDIESLLGFQRILDRAKKDE